MIDHPEDVQHALDLFKAIGVDASVQSSEEFAHDAGVFDVTSHDSNHYVGWIEANGVWAVLSDGGPDFSLRGDPTPDQLARLRAAVIGLPADTNLHEAVTEARKAHPQDWSTWEGAIKWISELSASPHDASDDAVLDLTESTSEEDFEAAMGYAAELTKLEAKRAVYAMLDAGYTGPSWAQLMENGYPKDPEVRVMYTAHPKLKGWMSFQLSGDLSGWRGNSHTDMVWLAEQVVSRFSAFPRVTLKESRFPTYRSVLEPHWGSISELLLNAANRGLEVALGDRNSPGDVSITFGKFSDMNVILVFKKDKIQVALNTPDFEYFTSTRSWDHLNEVLASVRGLVNHPDPLVAVIGVIKDVPHDQRVSGEGDAIEILKKVGHNGADQPSDDEALDLTESNELYVQPMRDLLTGHGFTRDLGFRRTEVWKAPDGVKGWIQFKFVPGGVCINWDNSIVCPKDLVRFLTAHPAFIDGSIQGDWKITGSYLFIGGQVGTLRAKMVELCASDPNLLWLTRDQGVYASKSSGDLYVQLGIGVLYGSPLMRASVQRQPNASRDVTIHDPSKLPELCEWLKHGDWSVLADSEPHPPSSAVFNHLGREGADLVSDDDLLDLTEDAERVEVTPEMIRAGIARLRAAGAEIVEVDDPADYVNPQGDVEFVIGRLSEDSDKCVAIKLTDGSEWYGVANAPLLPLRSGTLADHLK